MAAIWYGATALISRVYVQRGLNLPQDGCPLAGEAPFRNTLWSMKPLLLAILALAICPQAKAEAAEQASDPSGQWVRADGKHLGLLISPGPDGLWIVESFGESRIGQAGNACWRIHAGSLNEAELVTSSDADKDLFNRATQAADKRLTRDMLPSYEGLFVSFSGDRAKVSGPESKGPECALAGIYTRESGVQPTISYHSNGMLGPRVGDERLGAFANANARPIR